MLYNHVDDYYTWGRRYMQDKHKTKEHPLNELTELRKQVTDLERSQVEHMRVADALRKSEKRFRTLIEKSPEVTSFTDINHKRIYVSPNITAILGYSVEEFLTLDRSNCYHPEDFVMTEQERYWAYQHPGQLTSFVSRMRHKNGSWRWVEVSLRNLRKEPSVRAMVVNFRDIAKLKEAEIELEMKSRSLEEVNIALRVLLEQRARDQNETEDRIIRNVTNLVQPYIDLLKEKRLDEQQRTYLNVIETNLKNIVSPFAKKLISIYENFTPLEIRVADFIRDGKSAKEIAKAFGVSENAINLHRQHIRNKLGLNKRKINLRTYLLSLQ
jgi:PAS domain S-box-containing protein